MPFLKSLLDKWFGGGENHHMYPESDDNRIFGDRFRNPIWQNDEEDDDDYSNDYRQHGPSSFHFEIFTNPFEMTKYFEKEMDELMKNAFKFGIGGNNELPFEGFMPPASEEKSLRDEVLKPGYALPSADYESGTSKYDQDLDDKVNPKDFARLWDKGIAEPEGQLAVPNQKSRFRSFGQSTVSQTIRRPDGSIEEKRTTKDNEGNTETVIKHRIGDKVHETIVKTDKNGIETKIENFENMDPDEVTKFNKNWTPIEEPIIKTGTLSQFPWHKFFDFDPKI